MTSFSLSASATKGARTIDRGIIFDRRLQVMARDKTISINPTGQTQSSTAKRLYPQGHLGAHTVGFSRNGEGLAGLEFSFDTVLTGHYSPESLPTDAIKPPAGSGRHGFHLVSTLDLTVQKQLESVLAVPVAHKESLSFSGVLLHIDSGEILALSSMPGFNPNHFWDAPPSVLTNHFLNGQVALGSFAAIVRQAFLNEQINHNTEELSGTDTSISAGAMGRFAVTHLGMGSRLLPEITQTSAFTFSRNIDSLHLAETRVSPLELMTILASIASGQPAAPGLTAALVDRESGTVFKRHAREKKRPLYPFWEKSGLPWIMSNIQLENEIGQQDTTTKVSDHRAPNLLRDWLPTKVSHATACMFEAHGELYLAMIFTTGLPESLDRAIAKNKIMRFISSIQKTARLRPLLPSKLPLVTASSLPARILMATTAVSPPVQPSLSRTTTMPQVTGLSLREGLTRLSGMLLEIDIQGSGAIISQTPAPGAHITSPTRCRLLLASAAPESPH